MSRINIHVVTPGGRELDYEVDFTAEPPMDEWRILRGTLRKAVDRICRELEEPA